MKSIKNFFAKAICYLIIIAASSSHLFAQPLEVHLFEHSDYGGSLFPLNVEDCMKNCSYANNQWTDEISSVKVPDGYVLTIYDGKEHQMVGNCPELYCIGREGHWDNVNNGFSIKKLPAGWDAPANLPTGIYRFFNPYEGQYLTAGGRNMEDGAVAKNANNYRTPEDSDNAFNFLLIRDEKTQDYTIVSLATGRNWRPKGSGKKHFSIKAGTPLEGNHFSNTDSWSNFTFQPVGMANIEGERRLFSVKTKGSDDHFLTLPCRERGATPTFEKGGKNTAQQWEIQLVEKLPNLNQDLLKLISEKNEKTPHGKQMTMLEFLDEETTVPHKKMSIKVPFYAVNDNKFGFKKRMESYPIYILEREEFVIRKGSNKGWTMNRRDKDIEFLVSNTTSNTSGSSTSFNIGTSIEFSNEIEAGAIFAKTKSTITVGLTMGFDKSWHSSHTQSLTTTVKESVSPCTKAAIYALATKITVRRADKSGNPINEAPVAEWTYFDKNSVIYDALPLHPDECSTLSDEDYQKKLATWKRKYENKLSSTTSANSNATPNPQANSNNSTPFYQYYNKDKKDHHFTTNANELGPTGKWGYKPFGITCHVYATQQPGTVPFYQYYNKEAVDHHFTIDKNELGPSEKLGYKYINIACYVYKNQHPSTIPLYRYYNPVDKDHHFTTNFNELSGEKGQWGYKYEGIACYVYPK